MNRIPFPRSSLTGAWRDGNDEARRHAFAAMAQRLRLAEEMRAFLKLHAAALIGLVRDMGDREASVVIGAVVVSMTRSMAWSEDLGRRINRADKVLTSIAKRSSTSPGAADALETHRLRLRAMRRRAAEIIHLDIQARIAADRSRSAGRACRAAH